MPSAEYETKLTIYALICLAVTLSILASLSVESVGRPLLGINDREIDGLPWIQPDLVNTQYPRAIAADNWSFDYEPVEQRLQQVNLDETNALIIDGETAKVLEQAIIALPSNMSEKSLERLAFLVRKGKPGASGMTLATLLSSYYRYQQAQNALTMTADETLDDQQGFQQELRLKERYFGKDVMQDLFGKKHAFKRYLFARQQIHSSHHLSPEQKQQQLAELLLQFRQTRLTHLSASKREN